MSDDRTFEERSEDLEKIMKEMAMVTMKFNEAVRNMAEAFGAVAMIGSCCRGRIGIMYPDPANRKLHTKECINKEIDYLMNHCAPDSINKISGLTTSERINQLAGVIK